MNIKARFNIARLAVLSAITSQLAAVHGQGILTPPGAPAPGMKTLAQIEPRIPISSLPYTISSPGSYYVTTNLTGTTGIVVTCGNVTLDLGGFVLQGSSGSANGVFVSSTYTNVVVRNGILTGWGGSGLNAFSSGYPRNLLFEHLTVSANGYDGLYTEAGSVVRDCLAYGNANDGISSVGGEITHCISRGNGGSGFSGGVIEIGSGCTLRQCLAEYNAKSGFTLTNSQALDCESQFNTNSGFNLGSSRLLDCHSQYNFNIGIDCNGNGNQVSRCRIAYNQGDGIDLEVHTGGTQIQDCDIAYNSGSGVFSYSGSGGDANIARNNFISPSSDSLVLNDNNNYVDGNRIIISNGYSGIYTLNGTNNVVIRNAVASGGGINNYIVGSGNDYGPIGSASSTTSPWANISH